MAQIEYEVDLRRMLRKNENVLSERELGLHLFSN
jgi:hypothetical protein